MELNREQIIKAMECCHTPLASDCNNCGYRGQSVENGEYIGCVNCLIKDALSLIKELTEVAKRREDIEKSPADCSTPSVTELQRENERLKPQWISTAERLPENPDNQYLIIANGKPKSNITLVGAVFIAEFDEYDGWIIDGHEDWQGFEVLYWREVPPVPVSVKELVDAFFKQNKI